MAPSMPVRCTLLVIAILFAGIFAGCLSVRERLAARAERSGGDYRAECRSLASIALAEYLYHSHTNTENNAAYFSFCTRGRLSAVSVLGAVAIWRNLKKQKKCTVYSSTVHVTCYFAGCLSVRKRLAARAERSGGDYRAECRSLARFTLAEHRYHSNTNTGNNATYSSFCTGGWLSAVSVLEAAAIWRDLKNRKNAPPIPVRCTLLISQKTPCSESRAFGWRLLNRTPKPCKVHSCRTLVASPHKYKKQRCPFRFLQQRTAVCCICSGSCCNLAKFEKTKEMHRLFQYGARCLSVRKRLAARAERSGGDYRAECGSFARFTLAEHRYHSHTNTENNAACSGFCTGGWLSAVSVLEAAAIWRNLKRQKECTAGFQYGARCLSVRKRFAARARRSGGDY